jgi:predicted metal-dependent phosphoesterase TrpH
LKDESLQVRADLHTHSRASDGDLAPDRLITLAARLGLEAIALTDHDTLAGVSHARNSMKMPGIQVIAGVEISAEYEPGMLHILGYFPVYPDGLEADLEEVQTARRQRIPKIIKKLHDLGCMLTEDDVMSAAGEAQIGRPHIAKALLMKGYVRTFDEAFHEYLGKGKKAYVPKDKMGWDKAITLIMNHGGLPVLAHPYTLGLNPHGLKALVSEMKASGLAGIEAIYPEQTPEQAAFSTSLASQMGLIITGGTDFHGPCRNTFSPGDYGLDKALLTVFLDRLQS